MIHIIYTIILWLASLIFIPYHIVRSLQRKRPVALGERFGAICGADCGDLQGNRPIWVHAVSVGETIAVAPLIRAMRERFPDRKIVISNVTETGRSIALKIPEADLCLYFPFDFTFAAKSLLTKINPAVILIVETEIWPNFLRVSRLLGIPSIMVNGRISDRSFPRYMRFRWFFRSVLTDFSRFCMQTREDARRIAAMGAPADRIDVTRNLKYDIPVSRVTPERKAESRRAYAIPDSVSVFTAGSTHQGEEEQVIAAYRRLCTGNSSAFMVLVPRHPERASQVAELLAREGISFTLRSQLASRSVDFRAGEVLLVDSVGELMRLYAASDLVFVGGSLVPTGGHNILEPASLRIPVLFGPHMSNFRESAALLLASGGGVEVANGEELARVIEDLLKDDTRRSVMGESGARLMEENSGSTQLHLRVVESLLEER
jgi:3-deoxy-D-manno-octulosonic-acid transferase